MRKLLLAIPFLFAASLIAQPSNPAVQYVAVAPSGACSAAPPIQVVISTGAVYTCNNGTWGQVSGSGGGGSVTPESYSAKGDGINLFDGQIGAEVTSTKAMGTSSSPTAATATSTVNNALVLSSFELGATYSVNPAPGTIRVNDAFGAGQYGISMNEQSLATPSTNTAVAGTFGSSTAFASITILIQSQGTALTFVNKSSHGINSAGANTITVPASTANGNLMIACVAWFSGIGGTMTPPAGWTEIDQQIGPDSSVLTCWRRIASSEPANYSWTSTQGGNSGYIATYSSPLALNNLHSATATFTSADAGKLICVQGAASSGGQKCGTISAFVDAHNVTTSFSADLGVNAKWFGYATDDSTAFTNMLTACATNGCGIALSPKRYGLSAALTLPANVPITINGAAAGVPATDLNSISGLPTVTSDKGSTLQFLTTSLVDPAISVTGTVGHINEMGIDELNHFGIYCGVGYARDGCGSDGVAVLNFVGFSSRSLIIGNAAGNGIYIDGLAQTSFLDTSDRVNFDSLFVFFSGGAGVSIGSTLNVYNVETTNLTNCEIEGNGGPGILMAGPNLQGVRVQGCLIQWNNSVTPDYEISVTGNVAGGEISGNYFEIDANLGSQSNSPDIISPTTGTVGIHWGENVGINSAVSRPPRFTASQLPACIGGTTFPGNAAYVDHKLACVSDATACTNGTTLVGSGAVMCKVQCVGIDGSSGNWKETGTSGDCN